MGGIEMDYREAVQDLAPCGLDCSRCADHERGEIKQLSQRLRQLLGNYGRLAQIKAAEKPAFEHYAHFREILSLFADGPSCGGCRSAQVKCPISCLAKTCHKEKKVDFCFQCGEYPCTEQFKDLRGLRKRWQENNDAMKETGVAAFHLEQKKRPRY